MTVAAVIVPRDRAEALADAAGRAAVRRIVDVAWAGGAMPLIVVVDDTDGAISAAIAGSPARIAASGHAGSGSFRTGADEATTVVVGTDGWLLWPGDHAWVDPETVTSLIEAHGARPEDVLRPVHDGRAGWPILVPLGRDDLLDRLASDPSAVDGGAAVLLDLGDPGPVATLAMTIDEVPEFVGPASPVSGPPPDWGAAAADEPD